MPYGNGMGPDGMGPGTGRKMGYCAGYDRPGCYNKGFSGRGRVSGRGMGFGGRGFGRGPGRAAGGRFFGFGANRPGFDAENSISEIDFLKGQQEDLELELAAVKERIKAVDEKAAEK